VLFSSTLFILHFLPAVLLGHFVLPNRLRNAWVGISFFTFTQIAFLVDTYQGKVKEFRLIHYALFVTYFPHLVAGPVLHHKEMMPQFADPANYSPRAANFAVGCRSSRSASPRRC
jgi:D-alanyl-lipoteichoic acid acyltransferase DltB (MBOAT superfamily)